jgi:hypothetical protein
MNNPITHTSVIDPEEFNLKVFMWVTGPINYFIYTFYMEIREQMTKIENTETRAQKCEIARGQFACPWGDERRGEER